jgi:hypothetical protein
LHRQQADQHDDHDGDEGEEDAIAHGYGSNAARVRFRRRADGEG